MAQYRKKPVVIEAIRWNGNTNKSEVEAFVGYKLFPVLESETAYAAGIAPPLFSLPILTKEGVMRAMPGDYIIKEPFPQGIGISIHASQTFSKKTYEPA